MRAACDRVPPATASANSRLPSGVCMHRLIQDQEGTAAQGDTSSLANASASADVVALRAATMAALASDGVGALVTLRPFADQRSKRRRELIDSVFAALAIAVRTHAGRLAEFRARCRDLLAPWLPERDVLAHLGVTQKQFMLAVKGQHAGKETRVKSLDDALCLLAQSQPQSLTTTVQLVHTALVASPEPDADRAWVASVDAMIRFADASRKHARCTNFWLAMASLMQLRDGGNCVVAAYCKDGIARSIAVRDRPGSVDAGLLRDAAPRMPLPLMQPAAVGREDDPATLPPVLALLLRPLAMEAATDDKESLTRRSNFIARFFGQDVLSLFGGLTGEYLAAAREGRRIERPPSGDSAAKSHRTEAS